ncbi:unnamed protein product [Malus baccata var. baccata]
MNSLHFLFSLIDVTLFLLFVIYSSIKNLNNGVCILQWRDRLVGDMRKMQAGGLVELATQQECKINGSVEDGLDDSLVTKEEKPTINISNAVQSSSGKKRLGALDRKRAKLTSSVSGDSAKELDRNVSASQDDVSSSGTTTSRGDGDSGPVQQLVAMFDALVAQGEKAVGSLEILISSISADLLAEVVMANMCNLPLNLIGTEGDESLMNMGIFGGDSQVKYPPSFIADVLSLTSTFPPIAALLDARESVSNDIVVQFSVLVLVFTPFFFFSFILELKCLW